MAVGDAVDGSHDGRLLRAYDEHLSVFENLFRISGQEMTDVGQAFFDIGSIGTE
jgi:hypothetical protein